MIAEAWDDRSDMRCCVRQLQVLLVKRERARTPRDDQGERKEDMVPAFSFQDLDKRGGLIDQAAFMLEGVEGSRHDQLRRPKMEVMASSKATNRKIFKRAAKALEAHL